MSPDKSHAPDCRHDCDNDHDFDTEMPDWHITPRPYAIPDVKNMNNPLFNHSNADGNDTAQFSSLLPPALPTRPSHASVPREEGDSFQYVAFAMERSSVEQRIKEHEDSLADEDVELAEVKSKAASDLKEKQKEVDDIRKMWKKAAGEHSLLEQRIKDCEDLLAGKDRELAQTQRKAESDLERKQGEVDEVRKNWKKAAAELNKALRVKDQGLHQLTDQYLIDKITSLRFNIRNFSIQYFEGELKSEPKIKFPKNINFYVEPSSRQDSIWESALRSGEYRSSQIQASLWRILCKRIFKQFAWAGEFADDMKNLHGILTPAGSESSLPTAESERKFQSWSATTASLLLDNLALCEGSKTYTAVDNFKRDIIEDFNSTLGLCSGADFRAALFDILTGAIDLDQELSRQVAKYSWVLKSSKFDPSTMDLEGEKPGQNDVQLIIAPGLKKRGKSNGEDFKLEISLMSMKVYYVPTRKFGSRQ